MEMTLEQAIARIEELERKVRDMEYRQQQHVHYHVLPAPVYHHQFYQPVYPPSYPYIPFRYEITCGAVGAGTIA